MTNDDFLHAILDEPDDDNVRLVYADWLEEHDELPRAEFIRVQCQLASLAPHDRGRSRLLQREKKLLAKHTATWLEPLRPFLFAGELPEDRFHPPLQQAWEFRRGFVETAALRVETFLEHAEELFALAPIRAVWFAFDAEEGEEIAGDAHRQIARSPYLARLHTLDLSGHNYEMPTTGTNKLIRSPHLANLERLYLRYGYGADDCGFVQPESVRLLLSGKYLPRLRVLDLSLNEPGSVLVAPFRRAKRPPTLEYLGLRGMYLNGADVEPIAQSAALANLTELDLRYNNIGDRGAHALAELPHLSKLTRLLLTKGKSYESDEPTIGAVGRRALHERFGDAVEFQN